MGPCKEIVVLGAHKKRGAGKLPETNPSEISRKSQITSVHACLIVVAINGSGYFIYPSSGILMAGMM